MSIADTTEKAGCFLLVTVSVTGGGMAEWTTELSDRVGNAVHLAVNAVNDAAGYRGFIPGKSIGPDGYTAILGGGNEYVNKFGKPAWREIRDAWPDFLNAQLQASGIPATAGRCNTPAEFMLDQSHSLVELVG